jgi:hypothetical protein
MAPEGDDPLPDGADIPVTYRMIREARAICPRVSEHDIIWLYRVMAEIDPFRRRPSDAE